MLDFARVFMQCNPLYLNLEYAKAHGFPDLPASPQMVFNVVLSLGVHNDSEKAIANLGYYNVQFLRPVYSGDTLRGYTQVVDRKARGQDKPGIVLIRTLGREPAQSGGVAVRAQDHGRTGAVTACRRRLRRPLRSSFRGWSIRWWNCRLIAGGYRIAVNRSQHLFRGFRAR
jgi:acyl dehydratase